MALDLLVGGVIAALTPFLAKGGEAFAKEAGKETFQKVKQLLGSMKSRLAADDTASRVLSDFEREPVRFRNELAESLRGRLAVDPQLASHLAALLQSIGSGVLTTKPTSATYVHIGQASVSTEVVHQNKTTFNVTAGGDVHLKE